MSMNAFIYAAGRATRLGPEHANRPKILLDVGGRSLLEWHIMKLGAVGVRRVFVITGHGREQIASQLPILEARHGIQLQEIFNAEYLEGSVLSLNVSLPDIIQSTGPVLLMDGDVFYDLELLQRLLASPDPSVLLVDLNYAAPDEDPVIVPLRNGRPFELQKGWSGDADKVGESVGFFRIDPDHIPLLAQETRRRTVGILRRDSLDEILRFLVLEGCFHAVDITGLPWTEIDYPYDLEYARDVILPKVQERVSSGS
jgi:choline kinase